MGFNFLFLFVCCVIIKPILAERLHGQIYSSIEGGAACFRRLNGTHQAGCSSSNKGAIGVVHMVKDVTDAQWLVFNGSAGPYMAVVSTATFQNVVDLLMDNPHNVAGILLYENATERYNLDLESQVGKPLCSIQLNSFMWAAVNSIVCRRRSAASALLTATKVCDPLGDNNVYYSLFPRDKGQKKKDVILVTARIDTASLFDGIAPGAASSVVGMVALMSAAATLSKIVPAADASKYGKNVLWTLLNGESFDYIGSQRVAFDLARGAWPPDAPLAPSDIALHLEIGQIGGSLPSLKDNEDWPLYAYAPEDPGTLFNITNFLKDLKEYLSKNNVTVTEAFSNNLPPSSLHSFRRLLRNATSALPELLLADHNGPFTNMFYNSALDDYEKINYKYHNITIGTDGTFVPTETLVSTGNMTSRDLQVKIAHVATALAHTLHQQVTGLPYSGDVTASAHLVDELLYCFLEDKLCKLLSAADFGGQTPPAPGEEPPRPAPLYVGVATYLSSATAFAGHLMALLAGQHLTLNKTECDAAASPDFSYYWLRGWNHSGVCIETNMNFSEAISPAFIVPEYDFTSGEYSTWTESVWQAMWARVFVSSGGGGASAALAAGAVLTVFTALLTYWLQRNVHHVFVNAPHPSIHSSEAVPGILRTVNC
ncbi:nicastrin isoform X2 [Leguminivora glycinivorella]|uniref:nicastrin isoform X2 n=1 Tax=Leguminivora glycinivorella TaxID=1035111 RepID=UPI00200C9318|nr:nicastrin isoform X2 [Leguminivora glycinivorella]